MAWELDGVLLPLSPAHRPNPYVEGCPLYVYGHSIIMYPGIYNTPYAGEMAERVRSRLNMGRAYFMARSGTYLMDNVSLMLGTGSLAQPNGQSGSRQWQPGRRGIILHQNYGNEIVTTRGNDPLYVNQWAHSLRTAFALFSAETVVSASSAAKSGTANGAGEDGQNTSHWAQHARLSGGNWFWNDVDFVSTTVNSTLTFTVPGGDEAWVLLANSVAGYAAPVDVSVNGTVLRSIAPAGQMVSHVSSLPGNPTRTYLPTAYKITGLNAAAGTTGSKSLVVKVTGSGTAIVSAVFVPNPYPPHIFYGLDFVRQGTSPGAALSAEQEPKYRAAALGVIAEFPNAHAVDMNDGWNGATMVSSLDVQNNAHPNDLGMIHHADKYVTAINQTITGPIRGVMTL